MQLKRFQSGNYKAIISSVIELSQVRIASS